MFHHKEQSFPVSHSFSVLGYEDSLKIKDVLFPGYTVHLCCVVIMITYNEIGTQYT